MFNTWFANCFQTLWIYWILLTKQNFQIICMFFSLIFKLKLDEPFRNQEIFIISLFFNSSDLGFESFWLIFWPLDPDPWIRIFLRIQILIQEAKILGIQRIRILSTELMAIQKYIPLLFFPPFLCLHDWVNCLVNCSVVQWCNQL